MPPESSEHAHWFFEQVQPHESMLRAWLQGRFPADCDIDDIIQETYVRAVKAREDGKLFAPKAFLFTTARNLAIDRARHLKHARTESLANSPALDVIDEADAVPEQVARHQEIDILKQAIASLPRKCREIFVMRRVQGLSRQEIATRLGVSTNTVSAQLTIGLLKCSEFFERYDAEGAPDRHAPRPRTHR